MSVSTGTPNAGPSAAAMRPPPTAKRTKQRERATAPAPHAHRFTIQVPAHASAVATEATNSAALSTPEWTTPAPTNPARTAGQRSYPNTSNNASATPAGGHATEEATGTTETNGAASAAAKHTSATPTTACRRSIPTSGLRSCFRMGTKLLAPARPINRPYPYALVVTCPTRWLLLAAATLSRSQLASTPCARRTARYQHSS
jgi:hypothetical protein